MSGLFPDMFTALDTQQRETLDGLFNNITLVVGEIERDEPDSLSAMSQHLLLLATVNNTWSTG